MKIECPDCHLTGEMNESEIPLDGRYVDCPRCRSGFHVKKAEGQGWNPNMMNTCPGCQYSTFTDEMFDVCPKCGLKGSEVREKRLKKQKIEQVKSAPAPLPPQAAMSPEDFAILQRDQERLQKSLRSADFVEAPSKSVEPEAPLIPIIIRNTGWGMLAVSISLMLYGIIGLYGYFGKDIYAQLNETSLEPVSKAAIFFRYGFLPWVMTVYGLAFTYYVGVFLQMKKMALKRLELTAWCGMGIGAIYEVVDFIRYIQRASANPSFFYYFVGIIISFSMIVLWSALAFGLIWWLRNEKISDEFEILD